MLTPHRARAIALSFCAGGIVASVAAVVLPDTAAGDTTRGILFMVGITAALFGGGTALFRHFDARAKDALARGEHVLTRWHVDAATWREFVVYHAHLMKEDGARANELLLRETVPAGGIEVIVGETAVQIGDSIHRLPRRGTPEITHAELNIGRARPSFVELHLYYPAGGAGASGVPHGPLRTALRFPAPRAAEREAQRAVAHYAGGRPGKPDFFHGRGDGTDPEDLSKCFACGYETHKLASHCPQCGAGLQSRRWARRFGKVLFVLGLFITGAMGAILYYQARFTLQPGVAIHDATFRGTRAQGLFFLFIMLIVLGFGVTAMVYGVWQVRTGGRSRRVVYALVGVLVLLTLIALAL